MIYACRWLVPIDQPPLEGGWIEVDGGSIRRLGQGRPPGRAEDLGEMAILPGLVNAHTHVELSWMSGRVPPSASMDEWIQALMRLRRAGVPGGTEAEQAAMRHAAAAMHASGTVLVGDISNNLQTPRVLVDADIGGIVFHELIGFGVIDPALVVREAGERVAAARRAIGRPTVPLRVTLAAHAPYSVAPGLFREIGRWAGDEPLSIHLGESGEEIEFVRTGGGPIRAMLEKLGVWNGTWTAPGTGPVDYIASLGYLKPGLLVVHAGHLTDAELERLRRARATIVTCPRSNLWVGGGMPRVSHFYASGVPVAIGTDSLASVETLSVFDELAELRRIAPDVAAPSLLESATRIGAEALGFGATHGTLAAGKAAALVAVGVPSAVVDVEEYLVSGVPADAVRRLS